MNLERLWEIIGEETAPTAGPELQKYFAKWEELGPERRARIGEWLERALAELPKKPSISGLHVYYATHGEVGLGRGLTVEEAYQVAERAAAELAAEQGEAG